MANIHNQFDKLPDSDPDGNLSPLTDRAKEDKLKVQHHSCCACELCNLRYWWQRDRSYWI